MLRGARAGPPAASGPSCSATAEVELGPQARVPQLGDEREGPLPLAVVGSDEDVMWQLFLVALDRKQDPLDARGPAARRRSAGPPSSSISSS